MAPLHGLRAYVGGSRRPIAQVAALLVASMPHVGLAEDAGAGAEEYRRSCLVCHGPAGTGDGPMADYLTLAPADLTRITERAGGTFPTEEIYRVIDGRAEVGAHGNRGGEDWEMPIWGLRYMADQNEADTPSDREAEVRARIFDLIAYLQSLQRP